VADIAGDCDQATTTRSDADAMEALTKLSQSKASRMMVVDEGRLVGLLSLKDLMKFIALKVELEDDTTASSPKATRRETSIGHQPNQRENPILQR
jgi:CBS domain containing-hemolysin-like protein